MMDQAPATASGVAEVEVAAHTLTLQRGTYCIHVADVSEDLPFSQLPGLGLSAAPGEEGNALEIARLSGEPWLRRPGDAVLIRVHSQQVRVLLTSYNIARSLGAAPPKIEVQRLDPQRHMPVTEAPAALPSSAQEIVVHVRKRGDQRGSLGEWIGECGDDLWVEGFTLPPLPGLNAGGLEYQAVLGKGWMSPWVSAGDYCGSRGMQLPLLGLCLRLSEEAAQRFSLSATAKFVDGTVVGPVPAGQICATEPLKPVAALRVEVAALTQGDQADLGSRKRSVRAARANVAAAKAAITTETAASAAPTRSRGFVRQLVSGRV